ncbi:MAG: EAL domain-containing protein [Hydrogenovibrio sp.]|uniref:EAL domain-containing protein n=1 Tax=Hydrogenovibrio sp. TaxID=2065821 RepID=UPI00286FC143|nr:EAL domain-containing protein [Hydrogenovibrio sp.]MDR9499166.1 EAL domain-containing protein [Hydrogenovibrio sp.]
MTGIAGQPRRFQCRLQGVIALFALWLLLWASVAQSDSQSLTLGVYADIPEEEALVQWQPLADYLDAQLPDHRIHLQALNEQGVHERIYTNQVDLLLVNPVLYEIVRAENTLTGAIATVQRQYDGMATSYLGGVMFSRADNTKAGFMPELAPLTDQRIAIAERESAGGFVIPLQEVLQKTGLSRNALSFQTLSHQDAVVEEVMAGQADLGFVRTGILERWLDQGRLQRQDLKIHTPRRLNSYPFLLSTTLYPEWPFLALSHIDNENGFLQYALDQMERLTDSRIGFLHKVDPDQKRIEMVAWSLQTEALCHADNETHYDVDQAGVWADSIRLKKPLINNAFQPSPQLSRLPAGHVTLKRILTVPILDNGQVVLLIGLGNKHQEYASEDSDTVELIGNQVWRLMLQQRSQQALQRQQAQYGRLLNGIGQNFCALSLSPKTLAFSYLSDSVADIFGIGKTDLLDRRWDHVVSWDQADQRKAEQALTRLVQGLDSEKALQLSFTTPDGDHRTLRMLLHRVETHDRTLSLDGLIENITYRLKSENDLKQAANVFRYAQEGIFITDTDGVILNVNQAFEKVTGYRRDEAIGQRPSLLKSGHHDRAFYQSMWQQLLDQGYWSGEVWNQRKNGEIYPEKLTLSAIHNQQGEPVEFIALFSDITVQKKQQQQLEYIAHFDSLTGLPNRSLLSDRLNQAMAFARRNHMSLAVAFIDLDGFKAINDLYGHQTGDQLLVSIADRFKHTLREEDTIARLGGDEFVAVMLDIKDKTEIYPLMERLLANANAAVTLSEVEVRVSASIGVSFYDPHSELDADQLVRQADQAMYQAKTQGKNQVFVFDHASSKTLARDSELLALEEALQNGDLCLHYQPKVNLRTGEILGYEALIRWQHPEKGLLGPGQFLTLLKDSPLSYQLGLWVIETALTQLDAWQKTGLYTAVSVNIEGDQLLEPDFAERLAELLAAYPGIDPSALTLEILETSALEDLYRVAEAMGTCQQLGVKFSIDDFGTGYASLTYLKALPTDELKVDKSFVQDLLIDPQSLAILESVVGMGRAFDLDVIAEGMEKDEEAVVLLSLGYEWAQGYHIARPMPASDVIDWKNHWMPSPHWQSIQPLEKNQLALLTAATEHRGWVKQLEDHLLERTPTPPPMAIDACQFGHWLTHHGFEHFHKTEMYQQLQQTHEQVHRLGQSLLALKQESADRARIDAGLSELQSLKQTLLKQLQALSDTTPLYLQ